MRKLAILSPRGARVLVPLLAALALALPASAAAAGPLTVSPEPVRVPTTTVGMSSPTVAVELRNDGPEAVTTEGITLAGPDADQFGLQGSDCDKLEASQSCKAWFWFSPTSLGSKAAQLSVAIQGEASQEIPLSADSVPPQVSWSPGAYDFGMQRVYNGSAHYFQLENDGEAPVYFGNVSIEGPDSGNFWTSGGGCWSFPNNTIDPGQSCWVQVVFQPGEARAYAAELIASAGGAEFGAGLSGEGGRVELVAESNPYDFGTAGVGTAGELRTINLANQGNLPGGFFIAVVAGGDSGSFELLSETCSGFEPVQPGESCTAQVRFKPQSAGVKSARLALFGEEDGGTMVILQGEGVAAEVGLSLTALAFGQQAASTRSAAQVVLVKNQGAAPAAVDWVGLAGADADQFLLAGEECTDTALAPGASCSVRVRFAPDSAGAKSARLRVGGGFGTLTATLAGTGTAAAASPAVASQSVPAPAAAPAPAAKPRGKRFARNQTIHGPRPRPERRTGLGKKAKYAKQAKDRR